MNTDVKNVPGGVQAKQDRSRVSTHRLLDAASELIVEVGYEGATLAAIAKRAGYSHGLVTQRFGSKENMVFALVDRMTISDLDPTLLEHRESGGVLSAFDAVLAGQRRSEQSMRALYVLMFTSLTAVPSLRTRMADLHRSFRASISDAMRTAIDRGEYSSEANPEEIARSILSSLRGCAYQWLLDPDDFDFAQGILEQRAAMADRLDRLRLHAQPTGGDRS